MKKMMPKRRLGVIGLMALMGFMGFADSATAQSRQWSLRECCDYAVEHSLQIKQQDNQRRQQELQLSTARNSHPAGHPR